MKNSLWSMVVGRWSFREQWPLAAAPLIDEERPTTID